MNLTENEEKKRIIEWALRHNGYYKFDDEFGKEETYYSHFDNKDNIVEYTLDNIPQFMNDIKNIWNKDEVLLEMSNCCAIAAFKNKPLVSENNRDIKSINSEFEIPEYIYTL